MKNVLIIIVYLLTHTLQTQAQNITGMEYFFDADPGVGSGTAITVPISSDSIFLNTTISTTSLPAGFHFLNIRTKESTGNWGLYESRGFYLTQTAIVSTNIVAAEYYFDTDPGTGNGNPINITTSGDSIGLTTIIPTTGQPNGFHYLIIRVKDVNDNWSLYESRGFYMTSNTSSANQIMAAEYYIDADPGVGNATNLSIATVGDSVSFIAAIPSTGLSEGFHFLAIRVKDADSNWSEFETRGFYITTTTQNAQSIIAAEYFIDIDPGVGNGSVLTIAPTGSIINQNFICPTPSNLSNGQHFLFIRVQDSSGLWSLAETDSFQVTSNPTPIIGFHLSAAKKTTEVWLHWETLTEINTQHFEIEKSRNGIDFERTGTVKAAGNSKEKLRYRFIDEKPYNTLNFYRIKQTDIDGAFTYSNIVSVLFQPAAQTIRLYPNPTAGMVYLDMPKKGNYLLQCFNAQGQMIISTSFTDTQLIQLSTTALAIGTYYIRLSDGVTLFHASFIRNE